MTFSEFTEKYYFGNEEKAIHRLAIDGFSNKLTLGMTYQEMQELIDTMDESQANLYMDYFKHEMRAYPQR